MPTISKAERDFFGFWKGVIDSEGGLPQPAGETPAPAYFGDPVYAPVLSGPAGQSSFEGTAVGAYLWEASIADKCKEYFSLRLNDIQKRIDERRKRAAEEGEETSDKEATDGFTLDEINRFAAIIAGAKPPAKGSSVIHRIGQEDFQQVSPLENAEKTFPLAACAAPASVVYFSRMWIPSKSGKYVNRPALYLGDGDFLSFILDRCSASADGTSRELLKSKRHFILVINTRYLDHATARLKQEAMDFLLSPPKGFDPLYRQLLGLKEVEGLDCVPADPLKKKDTAAPKAPRKKTTLHWDLVSDPASAENSPEASEKGTAHTLFALSETEFDLFVSAEQTYFTSSSLEFYASKSAGAFEDAAAMSVAGYGPKQKVLQALLQLHPFIEEHAGPKPPSSDMDVASFNIVVFWLESMNAAEWSEFRKRFLAAYWNDCEKALAAAIQTRIPTSKYRQYDFLRLIYVMHLVQLEGKASLPMRLALRTGLVTDQPLKDEEISAICDDLSAERAAERAKGEEKPGGAWEKAADLMTALSAAKNAENLVFCAEPKDIDSFWIFALQAALKDYQENGGGFFSSYLEDGYKYARVLAHLAALGGKLALLVEIRLGTFTTSNQFYRYENVDFLSFRFLQALSQKQETQPADGPDRLQVKLTVDMRPGRDSAAAPDISLLDKLAGFRSESRSWGNSSIPSVFASLEEIHESMARGEGEKADFHIDGAWTDFSDERGVAAKEHPSCKVRLEDLIGRMLLCRDTDCRGVLRSRNDKDESKTIRAAIQYLLSADDRFPSFPTAESLSVLRLAECEGYQGDPIKKANTANRLALELLNAFSANSWMRVNADELLKSSTREPVRDHVLSLFKDYVKTGKAVVELKYAVDADKKITNFSGLFLFDAKDPEKVFSFSPEAISGSGIVSVKERLRINVLAEGGNCAKTSSDLAILGASEALRDKVNSIAGGQDGGIVPRLPSGKPIPDDAFHKMRLKCLYALDQDPRFILLEAYKLQNGGKVSVADVLPRINETFLYLKKRKAQALLGRLSRPSVPPEAEAAQAPSTKGGPPAKPIHIDLRTLRDLGEATFGRGKMELEYARRMIDALDYEDFGSPAQPLCLFDSRDVLKPEWAEWFLKLGTGNFLDIRMRLHERYASLLMERAALQSKRKRIDYVVRAFKLRASLRLEKQQYLNTSHFMSSFVSETFCYEKLSDMMVIVSKVMPVCGFGQKTIEFAKAFNDSDLDELAKVLSTIDQTQDIVSKLQDKAAQDAKNKILWFVAIVSSVLFYGLGVPGAVITVQLIWSIAQALLKKTVELLSTAYFGRIDEGASAGKAIVDLAKAAIIGASDFLIDASLGETLKKAKLAGKHETLVEFVDALKDCTTETTKKCARCVIDKVVSAIGAPNLEIIIDEIAKLSSPKKLFMDIGINFTKDIASQLASAVVDYLKVLLAENFILKQGKGQTGTVVPTFGKTVLLVTLLDEEYYLTFKDDHSIIMPGFLDTDNGKTFITAFCTIMASGSQEKALDILKDRFIHQEAIMRLIEKGKKAMGDSDSEALDKMKKCDFIRLEPKPHLKAPTK